MCTCGIYSTTFHTVQKLVTAVFLIVLFGFHASIAFDPRGHVLQKTKHPINQPMFLPTQQNYTVYKGHMATIMCRVENLGTKTVIYRKLPDDNPLTVGKMTYISDPRIETRHVVHRNQWDLNIRDTKLSDAGTYECQVSTKERNLRQLFYLRVEESPALHPRMSGILITGNFHVEVGDTLRMTCNATELESPLEDISWFKDGDALDGNPRVSIYKSLSLLEKTIKSDLVIDRVEMTDTGYYLCRTTSELTTHKHVQILNTTGNKDKRGTLVSTDNLSGNKENQRNSAPSLHAKIALFCAFFLEILKNIFS